MPKIKLVLSILIFSVLLSATSMIKNQTRNIEKKIFKIEKTINYKNKDLSETQLDYFYLSSPQNLSKRVKDLGIIEYIPMDFSKIYLNYQDFKRSHSQISILQKSKDEKIQKK